jgi:protein-S-isoprenylcysteine O-methyltransferase
MVQQMDVAGLSNVTYGAVIVAWIAFALVFLTRRRHPISQERRRDRMGLVGVALQAVGFATLWVARRPQATPFLPFPLAGVALLGVVIVTLAAGSVLLVLWAVRTLGKQWALSARLVEGHELVTSGPYRWVRNPIYTGMLGMLVSTGLVVSQPWALLVAVAVFCAGTVVRVRAEERLLHEAFRQQWADWARQTPALIPLVW